MVSAHIHVQLLQSIKLTTFLWCWILFVNEPWPQGKSHSRAKFINNSTNVKDTKSGSRHKWKTNRWPKTWNENVKGHSGLCGFVWPTFRIVLLNSFAGNMQQLLRLILLIWWASATRACPRCVRSSLGADVFLMSWGPTAPRKAKAIKAH